MVKKGFTLAETLITLGIIGIVAALTMPALITKYQKKVMATQAQKAYSLLNGIFMKIAADEGVENVCSSLVDNYSDDDNYWTKTFSKYIEITGETNCQETSDSKCAIKMLNAPYRENSSYQFFYLKNGMKMNLYLDKDASWWGRLIIDVNGDKAPNTYGRDIFYWHLSCTNGGYKIYPRGGIVYAGNDPNSYWKTTSKWDLKCSTEETSLGATCTARLMENNWVMDY